VDPGLTPSIKTLNTTQDLPIKESNILVASLMTLKETSKLVPENTVINLIHAETLVLNTDISLFKTTVGAHAITLMLLLRMFTRRELTKNVIKVVLDKEMDGEMPSTLTPYSKQEKFGLVLNILVASLMMLRETCNSVLRSTVINLTPAEMLVIYTDSSPSRTTDNVGVTTVSLLPLRHTREDLTLNVIKVDKDKVMHGEMPSIKTLNGIEEDHSLV